MDLRIYHVVPSLNPNSGGPARSVPHLVRAINNVGVDSCIFTKIDTISNQENSSINGNISVHSIDRLSPVVEAAEETGTPLIIHTHGIWLPTNHFSARVARRFRIPLITSPRGMLEPWALNYKSWKKKIAWWAYQKNDLKSVTLMHATAESEARNLRSLGFTNPIAILPNGTDTPDLSDTNNSNSSKKTALFLGRIHPKKGLINLVQAWAQICPAGWQLMVFGPDEIGHQSEIEEEIDRNGLNGTIEFMGSIADKDKWVVYKNADLFILPTFSENFGIVVAEALASGIPVITTKGTPWQELETHNCGWWIDIGVEPLAYAIKEATSLPLESLEEMGHRGRRLVEQRYSWDKIGEEMLSAYEWILKGGKTPDCVITE